MVSFYLYCQSGKPRALYLIWGVAVWLKDGVGLTFMKNIKQAM